MRELSAVYLLQVASAHFLSSMSSWVERLHNTFDRSPDTIMGVQLNHFTKVVKVIVIPAPLVLLVYKKSFNLTSNLNWHRSPVARVQVVEAPEKPYYLQFRHG